jgi:histone H3/H4
VGKAPAAAANHQQQEQDQAPHNYSFSSKFLYASMAQRTDAGTGAQTTGGAASVIVEQDLIELLLAQAGSSSFDQNVVPLLMEAMHGHAEELLADAHDYAAHASRKTTEIGDLKLAITTRGLAHAAPLREATSTLALEVNQRKLPLIQGKSGLRIPPTSSTLLGIPFRTKQQQEDQDSAHAAALVDDRGGGAPKLQPSAPGGKRITINYIPAAGSSS